MLPYVRRLLTAGFAYQLGEAVAKVIALFTLPLYTHAMSPRDYGTADLLLTGVILISIVLRLGVGEAFLRFHFLDADPARRQRLARTTTAFCFAVTTGAALTLVAFAGPASELVLGFRDSVVMAIAALGLWAFANLEIAYALLRVEERSRTFARASLVNVALTVTASVTMVVGLHLGARGLLLGNFGATAVVLVGLSLRERAQIGLGRGMRRDDLGELLRFGLPTVPADVSVYALNVVDRVYLYRHVSPADAGRYALALKLATAVTLAVRGFQYAWPPLAYSIESDAEASVLYARVTTWYVAATGLVVVGLALMGRWVLRVLAAPSFYGAHEALPWVALGWALYGLLLVFTAIAGRARITTRNFPAAAAGLAVNVVAILILVPALGIAGAGIALCLAYVVNLGAMALLTRRLFPVRFEGRRLALLVAVFAAAWGGGDVLLPDTGAGGLLGRAAVLAAVPAVLWACGFLLPGERAGLRRGAGMLRARLRAAPGPG